MARGVNKVILIGNSGADPEVKTMPSGGAVVNLSVATSESWKDKSGERQERTEWHRVVFFGRLAEIVGQYIRKGSKMYVEGRLETRSWENDGIKRYSTEIIAREMQMLDSRSDRSGGMDRPYAPPDATPVGSRQSAAGEDGQAGQAASDGGDGFEDDIPF